MPSINTVERGDRREVRPRTPTFSDRSLPPVPLESCTCTPGMPRSTSRTFMAPFSTIASRRTTVRAPGWFCTTLCCASPSQSPTTLMSVGASSRLPLPKSRVVGSGFTTTVSWDTSKVSPLPCSNCCSACTGAKLPDTAGACLPATNSGLKNSCRLVCWPSWLSADPSGWAWIWMVLPACAAWLLTATALTARASARAGKRGKGLLLFTSSKHPECGINANRVQMEMLGSCSWRGRRTSGKKPESISQLFRGSRLHGP